jgi:hypothetical protein
LFDTQTAVFDLPQAIFTTSSVVLNDITASNIVVQNTLRSPEIFQNTRPVIDSINFSVAGDGLTISTSTIQGPVGVFTLTNFDTLSIVTNRFQGNYTTKNVQFLSNLDADSLISAGVQVGGGLAVGKKLRVGSGAIIEAGGLNVNGINMLAYDSDVWFVSETVGNDTTGDGRRLQSAYRTLGKALSQATAGSRIFVEAGTYFETFPLTVPAGVSIEGSGIRATVIKATTATNTQTAFLLNGETTLSDFVVTGFYKPGYAFKFLSLIHISEPTRPCH